MVLSLDPLAPLAQAAPEPPGWTLGFDLGGTFVDLLLRHADGRTHRQKRVRAPGPASTAALQALQQLLADTGVPARQVACLVHGTTLVTNLLVEHRAPPAAWITTRGFADVLCLGRQQRAELYTAVPRPAQPLALLPSGGEQDPVFELSGRIDAQGRELQPLDAAELAATADRLACAPVRSVGVGLLFSHLFPAHELAVAAALRQVRPDLAVLLSHQVDPQPREAERFAATALAAALQPVLADELGALAQGLQALGLPALQVMASDGRLRPLHQALAQPLCLALSGPVAALQAAAVSGRSLVCLDIGGTTTDLGLVDAGVPRQAEALTLGGYTLRGQVADIASLPVGGGSLVRLLPGGALRLGPASAGADPGPAAYGRGGTQATLSDALLLLGRLPERLAGGLQLDRARAEAALAPLAQALDLSPAQLAASVVDSAATAIAEGLKQQAFDRGFDAPSALLLAAGGGGAQHAAEVAQRVGMGSVWVPAHAGLLAAEGLVAAAMGGSGAPGGRAGPSQGDASDPAWPGVEPQGQGPRALFGRTQTAWVPPGWTWQLDAAGDLWLHDTTDMQGPRP